MRPLLLLLISLFPLLSHAARNCEVFLRPDILAADIGLEALYPIKDLTPYLERQDLLNFYEVGAAEIMRADNSMKYDFIRENHVFEAIREEFLENGRFRLTDGKGLIAHVEVVSEEGITIAWSNSGQERMRRFEFLRETLRESSLTYIGEGTPNAYMKAEIYREMLKGNYGDVSEEAFELVMAYVLADESPLTVSGAQFEWYPNFAYQANRLREGRFLALLPSDLLLALRRAGEELLRVGEVSGNNISHSWSDADYTASMRARKSELGDSFTIFLESQSMKTRIVVESDQIVMHGTFDTYAIRGTREERSFTVTIQDGQASFDGPAADKGADYAIFSDLFFMFRELEPAAWWLTNAE